MNETLNVSDTVLWDMRQSLPKSPHPEKTITYITSETEQI